jgi:hypothetical protein
VGHAHLTGGPHDLLACASRQRNHKGHGQNHRQEYVSASLIHSCVPFRAGRTPSAVASTRASQQARRIAVPLPIRDRGGGTRSTGRRLGSCSRRHLTRPYSTGMTPVQLRRHLALASFCV